MLPEYPRSISMDEIVDTTSCRACQAINENGDITNLFQNCENGYIQLSPVGMLFEELLGIEITMESWKAGPRYICNSCELQMRLFKKLKMSAQRIDEAIHVALQSHDIKYDSEGNEYVVLHVGDLLVDEAGGDMQITTVVADDEAAMLQPTEVEKDLLVSVAEHDDKVDVKTSFSGTNFIVTDNNMFVHEPAESEILHNTMNDDDNSEMMMTMKDLKANDDKEKINNCFLCSKEFSDKQEFAVHRNQSHNGKYPCGYCPKLLQTSNALRVHSRIHDGIALYTCLQCGKSFNQKVHYKYHMNRHDNFRQFVCTHCSKRFLSKYDLSVHNRTHTRERIYYCEMCGKDFMMLQHLKMHIYSHQAKSFLCLVCKHKFSSPSALRQHRLTIHENSPQYQCNVCDKKFRRQHHLMAHTKMHTNTNTNLLRASSSHQDTFIKRKLDDPVLTEYANLDTDTIVEEEVYTAEDCYYNMSNTVD